MARQPIFQIGQVVGDELVDQLDAALAIPAGRDPIGPLLDQRQRIGDRDAAFTDPDERMVVLGVTHAHAVVRRQPQLEQRGFQAGGLVRARRQDHDRALVENDLQLEPEITDRLEHRALIRLPGRHDAMPHGQRRDPAGAQRFHELRGRGLA